MSLAHAETDRGSAPRLVAVVALTLAQQTAFLVRRDPRTAVLAQANVATRTAYRLLA